MPVDNIININSDYYIAMYSAHASIIEKLVGENGMLRSLRVDGGGLKAPKGSYKDRSIFDNYLPETRKTLHAKIIYLDRPKILSLWTGNLRKKTLYDQENIIVTQRLTHRTGSKVKRWFANHNQNKHLIIHILKNGTAKIHSSGDSIWKNCQSSLENLECNLEDKLSLHAFSPWGSGHFVKNIIKELNVKNLTKLCLYTRQESIEKSIWIDTNIDNNNDLTIERHTRKTNTSFPHYKCIFITKKTGRKEKIVWSYIGSANLTKTAFFEKKNIECAIIFEKPDKKLANIFAKIKNKNNWEERSPRKSKQKDINDSEGKEFQEEYDDHDGFLIRKHSKLLCEKLKQKKAQSALETFYKQCKQYQLTIKNYKYKISISSIHENMFDLIIDVKGYSFPLSIKRINSDVIHSQKDINDLMEDLMMLPRTLSGKKKNNNTKRLAESVNSSSASKNVRFPMFDFLSDKDILDKKRKILEKLKPEINRLSDNSNDKDIINIWSQVIEQWNEV
ncbi:MAG TPA: hypothetical protein PK941_01730 [Paludibacter sp.]|nr:hypothetical protein [Paludibacter sp.]